MNDYSGFHISKEDAEKIRTWINKHDLTCKFSDPMSCGAIGGRFTYQFTPTGLGMITSIVCACNEEFNFTDYDYW